MSTAAPPAKKLRACDRCRRRKNRCDEFSPCLSCIEAKAPCTHHSIPQKRGPRPRERTGLNTQLEQRLAQLEHLLASIPHNPGTLAALSEEERKDIQRAASGQAAGFVSIGGDSYNTKIDSPMAASGSDLSRSASGSGTNRLTPVTDKFSPQVANFGRNNIQQPLPPPFDYVPPPVQPNFAALEQQFRARPVFAPAASLSPPEQPSPLHSSSSSSTNNPTAASRRNLIYRDKEGQLKFVGPSSGFPLLGLLKELQDGEAPESQEEDVKPNLDTYDSPPPRTGTGSATGGVWGKAADILSASSRDELVRGYFSVSHLLWPILHMPTFLQTYLNPHYNHPPEFLALVLSMCCLASRYTEAGTEGLPIFELCKSMLREELAGKISLPLVQTLFNLSVYAEGLASPSYSLVLLSEAVTIALDMGLHRRVDDWAAFSAVEIEVRKRAFWAIYCLSAKACSTFGRPPLIRLADVDVPEPFAVDDAYITLEGIGVQPADKPCVQAGFVAAIRLHMLLERTVEVINFVGYDPLEISFASMVLFDNQRPVVTFPSEFLIDSFARGLPGDWTFSPTAINDPDTTRFFQRTRAYALQQFIRLLIARHQLLYDVEQASTLPGNVLPGDSENLNLQHLTRAALGLVGCYATIKARGRLRLFGTHAIQQLAQSGSALICVILHTQANKRATDQQLFIVALEGLSACIAVLRHLGERRPAGVRSAAVLQEFAQACGVSLGYNSPAPSPAEDAANANSPSGHPLLRVLPRKQTMRRSQIRPSPIEASTLDWMLQAAFGKQLQGENGAPGVSAPFLPPPRFGVDATGTWSSTIRSPADSPSASGPHSIGGGTVDYAMHGEGWEQNRGFEGLHLGGNVAGTGEFGLPQHSSAAENVWPW